MSERDGGVEGPSAGRYAPAIPRVVREMRQDLPRPPLQRRPAARDGRGGYRLGACARGGESLDYVAAATRANTQPPHTRGLGY
jgi:hypothetical protein